MTDFVVLKSHKLPARAGSVEAEIILCNLPDNKYTPFVTWQRNIEDGGKYWGHYFTDVVEAFMDYQARCKK